MSLPEVTEPKATLIGHPAPVELKPKSIFPQKLGAERGSIPPGANPSLLIPRPAATAAGGDARDRERITQLEVQGQATRALLARASEETQLAVRRAEAAEERAQALATRLEALEARLAEEHAAFAKAIAEAADRAARPVSLREFDERLERLDQTTHQSRAALATAQHDLAEHARLFESRKARLDSLDARMGRLENDARWAELHRNIERVDLKVTALETKDALTPLLAPFVERLEALEARPQTPTTATRRALPEETDELRRVKGIGPKYSKMLRDMGITTPEQIAQWTEDDLTRVAAALSIPKKRLEKQGWIEAAKAALEPG